MQNMLVTQNDVMVTIEENVDQADDAVQKGSSEMVKAIELRKSSRKVKINKFIYELKKKKKKKKKKKEKKKRKSE